MRSSDSTVVGFLTRSKTVVSQDGQVLGRMTNEGELVYMDGKCIPNATVIQTKVQRDKQGYPIDSTDGKNQIPSIWKYEAEQGKSYPIQDGAERKDPRRVTFASPRRSAPRADLRKIAFSGVVRSQSGAICGYVTEENFVLSPDGHVVGLIKSGGEIVNLQGDVIDGVEKEDTKVVCNVIGVPIGILGDDGHAIDTSGAMLGRVQSNGKVINEEGKIVGTVRKTNSNRKGNPCS